MVISLVGVGYWSAEAWVLKSASYLETNYQALKHALEHFSSEWRMSLCAWPISSADAFCRWRATASPYTSTVSKVMFSREDDCASSWMVVFARERRRPFRGPSSSISLMDSGGDEPDKFNFRKSVLVREWCWKGLEQSTVHKFAGMDLTAHVSLYSHDRAMPHVRSFSCQLTGNSAFGMTQDVPRRDAHAVRLFFLVLTVSLRVAPTVLAVARKIGEENRATPRNDPGTTQRSWNVCVQHVFLPFLYSIRLQLKRCRTLLGIRIFSSRCEHRYR